MSIKIENTVTPSCDQWEATIRGARNAMNSWDRMDSYATRIENPETGNVADFEYFIGENDQDLLERLAKGGSVEAKYKRMLPIHVDVTAPLYFWKEADQYKVGTTTNSCSTMHKIAAKEFTLDDFSHEHLTARSMRRLTETIDDLNFYRDIYLNGGIDDFEGAPIGYEPRDKTVWLQMIQLLPSSYNQRRTWFLNYETLTGIYHYRKSHKLQEWRDVCAWIKNELPYSELITGEFEDAKDTKDDE